MRNLKKNGRKMKYFFIYFIVSLLLRLDVKNMFDNIILNTQENIVLDVFKDV